MDDNTARRFRQAAAQRAGRQKDPSAWREPNCGVVRHVTVKATPEVERVEAGFETVYERAYSRNVRSAALILGTAAVAEEIVQDAFVQLYRAWDRVDEPEAWVRVAVVHGCRSWQRRQVLERQRRVHVDLTATDPDGLAVRQALGTLTARQRAAVVLRYFDDLAEADIASALGCRPGTVKSLLARAMPKLKEGLAHD